MTTQFIDRPSEAQDAGDTCVITEVMNISGGGLAQLRLVEKNDQRAVIKTYEEHEHNMREITILKTLQYHKNIVKLLDLSFIPPNDEGHVIGIPLEYIEGKMLWDLIYNSDKRLEQISIGKYVFLLSEALDHCHKLGVIHRDVKAENVMITKTDSVKLIDFGMSHSKTVEPIPGRAGTPIYMAPEILREEPPGPGVDIWALGIIMFECFTKQMPFGTYDCEEMRHNILSGRFQTPLTTVPLGPRALLKRLLEVDIKKRISLKNLASSQWIMQMRSKLLQMRRTTIVRLQQEQQQSPKKVSTPPVRPLVLKPPPTALQRRPHLPKSPPKPPVVERASNESDKTISTSRCNSNFSIRTESTQIATPPMKDVKPRFKAKPMPKFKAPKPKDSDFVHTDLTRQPIHKRANRFQTSPTKASKRPAWKF